MRIALQATSLLGLLALTALSGRADTVRYHDQATGEEIKVDGTLVREDPAGIAIKPSIGPAQKIPATAIVDVEYTLPRELQRDYLQATLVERGAEGSVGSERTKQLKDARQGYLAVLPQVTTPAVRRQLQFKIARLTTQLAEADQPAELPVALQRLKDFKAANSDGWQITPCCRLLGELQIARHEYQAAQKTYQDLEAIRGIPRGVKQDCSLRIAELLLRQGKVAEARTRVNELIQGASDKDPQLPRLKIAQAECQAAAGQLDPAVKSLQALLQEKLDNSLKAHAYNVLGDCYSNKEKWQDALWNYLYVDVVYHQNREEHARAIYCLSKCFKKLGDTQRAQQYQDRLNKAFAGTEYQRRLAVEAPRTPAAP